MAVHIVNVRHMSLKDFPNSHYEYCGRPSALGNPTHMVNESDRDRACRDFAIWFPEALATNPKVRLTFDRLKLIHDNGKDLVLGCFCKPKRCHLDTVKHFLEGRCVIPARRFK
jgi:hypothetical protein